MSMLCLLQIVDRISRFAAEMPSMLSCMIRMAGPISRKTWSAPWWLTSVPGSVSEFGERFCSLVSPGEPGYSRWMRRERDPLSPMGRMMYQKGPAWAPCLNQCRVRVRVKQVY